GLKTLIKPFKKGTDEWSHPYHKPDNNPQSEDIVMKRPFMTHYMVEPWYCPLPMMSVISGGRVFKVFGDRSSARPQEPLVNKLLCMNAFNGTQLWQRDLSPGFMIHRNTLIATPDTLFRRDDKSSKLTDPIDSRCMALRKGRLYYYSEAKFLACLDVKSGKVLWRNTSKELLDAVGTTKAAQHWLLGFASTAYLKCSDDALYFAGPNRPL